MHVCIVQNSTLWAARRHPGKQSTTHVEYLHYLIAIVIDHFDRDAAAFRRREGPADGRVQRLPCRLVDRGFHRFPQSLIGIAAKKIGVADEESVAVIVAIEEPTGDVLGGIGAGAHLARRGVEDVDAFYANREHAAARRLDIHVGLSEYDEEIAGAGLFEMVGHVEVFVHTRLKHGKAAEIHRITADMGIEGEAADHQHIEHVARLPRCAHHHVARHGAVFRSNENGGGLFFALTLAIAALRVEKAVAGILT